MPLKAELEGKIGQSALHFLKKKWRSFFQNLPYFFSKFALFLGPNWAPPGPHLAPSGTPFGHLSRGPNRASFEDREPTLTDPSFAKLEIEGLMCPGPETAEVEAGTRAR